MQKSNYPAWLLRALNPNTPVLNGNKTMQTIDVEIDGKMYLIPTIRMGDDGKLYEFKNNQEAIDKAIELNDALLVPEGVNPTEFSKSLSDAVPQRKATGGAIMAAPEQLVLPLSDKTSPPQGGGPKKAQPTKKQSKVKLPTGLGQKQSTDPRDEAVKLVLQQSQKNEAQQQLPMQMPMQMPAQASAPSQATPQLPLMPMMAARGKTKLDKKDNMSVVIGLGSSPLPNYEEASMGGPTDPPPGATSDEVKDDQHVLMSEGELVVPANVVRFHGLGLYESLRREALSGLSAMEASGQINYDTGIKKAQTGLINMPATGQLPGQQTPQGFMIQNPAFVDKNNNGIDDRLEMKGFQVGPTTGYSTIKNPIADPSKRIVAPNIKSYESAMTQPFETQQPTSGTTQGIASPTVQAQPANQEEKESVDYGGGMAKVGGTNFNVKFNLDGTVSLANKQIDKGAGHQSGPRWQQLSPEMSEYLGFTGPESLTNMMGPASLPGGISLDITNKKTQAENRVQEILNRRAKFNQFPQYYVNKVQDEKVQLNKTFTDRFGQSLGTMVGATGQNQAFGGELANAGSMPVPPGMSADNIINTEIEEYNKAAGIDTQTNQVFDTSNEKEDKKDEVAKKAQDKRTVVTQDERGTTFSGNVIRTDNQGNIIGIADEGKNQEEQLQRGVKVVDEKGEEKDKIVCTAMNDQYGFGSFRQTIWLRQSQSLDAAYQKGYHIIFKPLLKYAYKADNLPNRIIKKWLEGVARRRTADIWLQKKGKRHPIGAIERAILEPICYFVGKSAGLFIKKHV